MMLLLFNSQRGLAQEVKVIKYPELLSMLEAKSDQHQIFNFWATWCRPCIKEMPYFEEANEQEGVEVIFVSLDDVEILENRVKKFLSNRKISSTVVLLDETDYNAFIDKVEPEWSGAIPATIFKSNKGHRIFKEQELNKEELFEIISNL